MGFSSLCLFSFLFVYVFLSLSLFLFLLGHGMGKREMGNRKLGGGVWRRRFGVVCIRFCFSIGYKDTNRDEGRSKKILREGGYTYRIILLFGSTMCSCGEFAEFYR